METNNAVKALAAIAHESRLQAYRHLVQAGPSGLSAGQLSEQLGVPPSSLSFHLKELVNAGLLSSRQEGRFVFYFAEYKTMNALLSYLTENCCGGNPCTPAETALLNQKAPLMSEKVFNTLFLCTGNSARSIMAEALLNHLGNGRFKAYSAGSHPGGSPNPFAIGVLQSAGLTVDDLRSKSWDEFTAPDAPKMDFIITLCDTAAGEQCPFWPGQPITAHWGFEDPAAFQGSDEAKRAYFDKIFRQIANRIKVFTSLPLGSLDHVAIKRELNQISQTPA